MNNNKIIIVSEKFNNFANHPHVLTIKKFMNSKLNNHNLIIGQGLTDQHHLLLNDLLSEKSNIHNKLDSSIVKNRFTHKHKTKNILVGSTKKINDHLYHLPMIIDENCELMDDHQTGKHIQGMLLVEAFRQTFIAVTEEFFPLKIKDSHKAYYVINKMDIHFHRFAFPLPINIEYEIDNRELSNSGTAKFSANVRAIQNNKLCAEMIVNFSVYPNEFISIKENELSSQIIDMLTCSIE